MEGTVTAIEYDNEMDIVAELKISSDVTVMGEETMK